MDSIVITVNNTLTAGLTDAELFVRIKIPNQRIGSGCKVKRVTVNSNVTPSIISALPIAFNDEVEHKLVLTDVTNGSNREWLVEGTEVVSSTAATIIITPYVILSKLAPTEIMGNSLILPSNSELQWHITGNFTNADAEDAFLNCTLVIDYERP